MNKGAFHVSREIFENEIWSDVVKFRIFFYILGKCVFKKEGIEQTGIHIGRGQYLRSMRNLQKDLEYREGRGNAIKSYPLTTIQRKIKSLEKEERITTKTTEHGTLFTVVNYDRYQSLDGYGSKSVEQQRNSDGTTTEQRRNNNKNVKNVKNGLEEENSAHESPFELFEENICMLSPLNRDSLIGWCEDLGDDLVLAAIKLAAKYGAYSYKLLDDILRDWNAHNVTTVEEARAYVKSRDKRIIQKNNTVPFRQKKVSGYDPSRDAF